MKIKVSKAMAKFINECAKEMGFKVSAKVVEYGMNEYKWNVDYDLFRAYDYGDYDVCKGTYKAILLTYPASYYAASVHLTTYQLNSEMKRYNVCDVEGLKSMIKSICEI